MLGMGEAGSSLRERVKSVLILVLAVGLLLLYTERETDTANPIDTYFQGLAGNEEQELVRSHLYLDCWEQEFQYACRLLAKGEFPETEYVRRYAEEARENYWEFAEAYSWAEAYWKEEMYQESESHQREKRSDELLETRKTLAKAEILKQQTLQMYQMLKDMEAVTGEMLWDGSFYFELF